MPFRNVQSGWAGDFTISFIDENQLQIFNQAIRRRHTVKNILLAKCSTANDVSTMQLTDLQTNLDISRTTWLVNLGSKNLAHYFHAFASESRPTDSNGSGALQNANNRKPEISPPGSSRFCFHWKKNSHFMPHTSCVRQKDNNKLKCFSAFSSLSEIHWQFCNPYTISQSFCLQVMLEKPSRRKTQARFSQKSIWRQRTEFRFMNSLTALSSRRKLRKQIFLNQNYFLEVQKNEKSKRKE